MPPALDSLPQCHDNLVGIDSDGCVFDTMAVKQREHFHPLIIRHWQLERIAPQVRACAELINLKAKTRGSNRFPALLWLFEMLARDPTVLAANIPLPPTTALHAYVNSGLPLGNPTLQAEVARSGDPELKRVLAWSLAVNEDIDKHMRPVPPFVWAKRALELIRQHSDPLIVSQTPLEALQKEWQLHNLTHYVNFIAAQEHGTKAEHLRIAAASRYPLDRILLIGDAHGDLNAALTAGVCFYPILAGHEEASWQRFCEEAYQRFLDGTYRGTYETAHIAAFNALLT